MEITNVYQKTRPHSNKALWTGRIISALCVLFLLFDAIMKIIQEPHAVEGSVQLGWSEHSLLGLGITLLVCTIFYIIPRTAIIGAILLTGYLGGATATMVRVGEPFFFSLIFGMLVWFGLFLRDARFRSFITSRER